MSDPIIAKDVQAGHRIRTEYSGVKLVESSEEISLSDNRDVMEVCFTNGLVQYYGLTEILEKV